MKQAKLILLLLLVACFSLATWLQPLHNSRILRTEASGNVLALLLGDARKMFAQQMFAKADAYFHRGNYPSIFDLTQHHEENHMAGESHHAAGEADHDDDDHDDALPPAHDWIERFGRHFYPTIHLHLKDGEEREMLPWLRVAVALDPHSIETYAVTAYWLRERLNKVDEAEEVLRAGLHANPDSPELYYELGRLFYENRKDSVRTRNLWVFALRRWHEVEDTKTVPQRVLLAELLGGLARIERQDGHKAAAIDYLKQLQAISPSPEQIQKQIDQLSATQTPSL